MPARLQAADLALFHRVAGHHSPALDRFLPRLSRTADKSALWIALSTVTALAGGRFGRRAALRGLFSLGATSAFVNLPAKLLLRRRRPPIDLVPLARRLRRLPTSRSFPSGHSASAFAFATGAALEVPALAAPLGTLAAAVAYSRVYTGVHYPGDVLAGAAIGAGIAVASQRLWPLPRRGPATVAPPREVTSTVARPRGEGVAIVANPAAGSGDGGDAAVALREALPAANVEEARRSEDVAGIAASLVDRADVVGVAGGDGTINTVARAALTAGKPLLVVPAGTLNHLARDLGLGSVDDAIDAVRSGRLGAMDVGVIDGRPFLNTASFGVYPELVDARRRLEPRIGKWPALVVGLVKVLRHGRPVDVEINGRAERVWMVFVGNCAYEPRGFAPTARATLGDRKLDVRLVAADPPFARTRLIAAVLTGTLPHSRPYRESVESELRVRSLDGPLRLAADGETFDGADEFVIGKLPERLSIYVGEQASA